MSDPARERPFQIEPGEPQPRVSRARVTEALVIALLSGVMSAVISGSVVTVRLEERIAHLQIDMNRQADSIEDIKRVIYRPSWEQRRSGAATVADTAAMSVHP